MKTYRNDGSGDAMRNLEVEAARRAAQSRRLGFWLRLATVALISVAASYVAACQTIRAAVEEIIEDSRRQVDEAKRQAAGARAFALRLGDGRMVVELAPAPEKGLAGEVRSCSLGGKHVWDPQSDSWLSLVGRIDDKEPPARVHLPIGEDVELGTHTRVKPLRALPPMLGPAPIRR